MNNSHGSLENEIMKTIWMIEEISETDVSVNEVQDYLNRTTDTVRAYTTMKTVMDRLVEKNMLVRYKKGKKFFYKSVSSRDEMAQQAIQKLVSQYFNNDMSSFCSMVAGMAASSRECINA